MANHSTSLRGPLLRLQNSGHRYYFELAERFRDNGLISKTWLAMADDFHQLGESLRALPRASVGLDKADEKAFLSEVSELIDLISAKSTQGGTLHEHMTRALDLEERITTRIYAPLIYRLKSDWTNRYSDFYIRVKAHITRLNRLILPCAGDPALIHRTNTLLTKFEKEVQRAKEPEVPVRKRSKAIRRVRKAVSGKSAKAKGSKTRKKATKPASSIKKRAKVVAKRTKPLIKNIKVSRRRASR